MSKTPFNKIPLSIEKQVELLQSRGMIVDNVEYAKDCLSKIGYYRLSGYWFKFQNKWCNPTAYDSSETDNFNKAIYFEDIINIYRYDTKLRSLFLDALEKIEISVTSHICQYMCENTELNWYTKEEYFDCNTDNFEHIQKELKELIRKNSNSPSLKNFFEKYSDEHPPFWIISPYLTFGAISKIYGYLKKEYRIAISKNYGINHVFLRSSLRHLTNIRNACAHYNRIWDKPITTKSLNVSFTKELSTFNYKFNSEGNQLYRLFSTFYIISLYLYVIAPDSKFCSLVKTLSNRYIGVTDNLISYEKLGFPEGWEQLPLFKIMLKNDK